MGKGAGKGNDKSIVEELGKEFVAGYKKLSDSLHGAAIPAVEYINETVKTAVMSQYDKGYVVGKALRDVVHGGHENATLPTISNAPAKPPKDFGGKKSGLIDI